MIGLNGPPGFDERSAKSYVLAHLLVALLLEPLIDVLEESIADSEAPARAWFQRPCARFGDRGSVKLVSCGSQTHGCGFRDSSRAAIPGRRANTG